MSEPTKYWLLKTEPSTYCWDDLVRDKKTFWNGVRNYGARNNLNTMQVGDLCLFYHSGDERQIIGVAKVIKAAYTDHTALKRDPEDAVKNKWVMVDIQAGKALKAPITLKAIKAHPVLCKMTFARQGRLSVSPVKKEEFQIIVNGEV